MLINKNKSIVPACDVNLSRLEELARVTADVDEIGAYKLGFVMALSVGLPRAVEVIRKYTNKPIIYDHQKAATDIPSTGQKFARVCKDAGVNAVILFPQAGPRTQAEWIESSKAMGLDVIVGGYMTHQGYLQSDGGYLADDAVDKIYLNAVQMGVTEFVLPGTKPDMIASMKAKLLEYSKDIAIYSPGLGAQGGDIYKASRAAGGNWHAIIGRSIYDASDIAFAVQKFAILLNS